MIFVQKNGFNLVVTTGRTFLAREGTTAADKHMRQVTMLNHYIIKARRHTYRALA
jgi:hypothetical protein